MDFKSALNKICQDFNKEIIFERRVISILDDYGAFKDRPYYKLFYKTALSSINLKSLIVETGNERNKGIFTFVSLSGFDKDKVKEFISIICECYPGSKTPENNKTSDSEQESIQADANSASNQTGNHIKFMGMSLGCAAGDMISYLRERGFKFDISKPGYREMYGPFAGFDEATVTIRTSNSDKIWQIKVILKADFKLIIKMYQQKYSNVRKLSPRGIECTEYIIDTPGGTIKLSKISYGIHIVYTDKLTKKQYSKEQIQAHEIKKQKEEQLIQKQIQKGINDI